MKKSELLNTLKKLEAIFAQDQNALDAIKVLVTQTESLPKDTFDTKKKSSELNISTLPEDVKGLDRAFLIFSDGACRGNPGPGAWASFIQDIKGEVIFKSSGVDLPTTNNKMELQGVIRGLNGLIDKWIDEQMSDRHTPVFVYSDSKYVIDGITSWVSGWKARGWKKADGKTPENVELWQELDQLNHQFANIKYIWVKGHAGHAQNEMCDQMCNQALDEAGF